MNPFGLLTAAHHWSAASQARARRNAMLALTSLAQRRAEREEADALFAPPLEAALDLPRPRATGE